MCVCLCIPLCNLISLHLLSHSAFSVSASQYGYLSLNHSLSVSFLSFTHAVCILLFCSLLLSRSLALSSFLFHSFTHAVSFWLSHACFCPLLVVLTCQQAIQMHRISSSPLLARCFSHLRHTSKIIVISLHGVTYKSFVCSREDLNSWQSFLFLFLYFLCLFLSLCLSFLSLSHIYAPRQRALFYTHTSLTEVHNLSKQNK